jgi:hypothetical protein
MLRRDHCGEGHILQLDLARAGTGRGLIAYRASEWYEQRGRQLESALQMELIVREKSNVYLYLTKDTGKPKTLANESFFA